MLGYKKGGKTMNGGKINPLDPEIEEPEEPEEEKPQEENQPITCLADDQDEFLDPFEGLGRS